MAVTIIITLGMGAGLYLTLGTYGAMAFIPFIYFFTMIFVGSTVIY